MAMQSGQHGAPEAPEYKPQRSQSTLICLSHLKQAVPNSIPEFSYPAYSKTHMPEVHPLSPDVIFYFGDPLDPSHCCTTVRVAHYSS